MLLTFVLAVGLILGDAFSTALSDAVALMPAKSWRTFVAGGSANFLTGDANAIFGYSNNGVWDANSGQLLFLGSPHWQPWNMIIWKDATNAWRNGPLPPGINSTVHSYDNVTMDPSSG